jgi:DNA-binding winged helix-turn-helix (wHTH) protein
MKIRFAGCTLDVDRRQLLRGAVEIHVSPKAFELLKLLVEERGRAVSKAELLERVWPGVFVSDASLARVVTEIRDAVGDRARQPRIVRTVHGFGYAFAADVKVEERPVKTSYADSRASCWFTSERRSFPLPDGEHIAGREPDATVCLESARVSRHHARIVVRGGRATVEDLGSKNGTFVRGARIANPTRLKAGDEIRIGPFTLVFRIARRDVSTETEVRSL